MDFSVTAAFVETANAAQIHEEARGTMKNWPASFVEVEPDEWVYRVDREDIDAAFVQKALDKHVPDPDYGKSPEQKEFDAIQKKKKPTSAELMRAIELLLKGCTLNPKGK